ncbi:SMP-30/Gluconolaconase/LRE-like domain-containing protein [Hirsutella rhossiliensis]|uniref:SMP-30/Gluconolaconase/LRE-like domain-containing protein n=1 Tax=Hirsutella rhossiliensis TaxID=111463 RepID=A0A9P8MYM7_9HYPO|nr:SMP-30/Gluconolaconase/LRE-like domain-containing protein [Hirsutella rhossiliensis]KAH0963722.1 SMP-30/Gluconolaconase/LRE-like domain-containing protein [Hirsutella rhossiliensis]
MAADLSSFQRHDSAVHNIFGDAPTLEVLLENKDYQFAHEAGVFIPSDNEDTLYVTSNFITDQETRQKRTQISRVVLPKDGSKARAEEINPPTVLPLPNGGVNYLHGIVMLVDKFISRPFNSPNDVVAHKDGSLWFTDPKYGSEQGIRPPPRLPQQVYRFDPKTNSIRVMADGFGRPNGIAFSPDQKIIYITDTDSTHGDGSKDESRVSQIYAFDVTDQPFLTNRRVFAMADVGIPDGIKTDQEGNVYSGCGDGINIWSPGGVLLGKILIEGGAANFCFGRDGQMFILNENKIWVAQLGGRTKGALLNI